MQHSTFTFRFFIKLFTALFFVVLATGLYAQASLSVQGVLTKSDGTAVDDGTYTVTFKLFDAPTGGNEVHSEPIEIETIGGVYSTVLGQNPGFPMTASFNTIYYLSVRVGSSELLPRPQLTHAPYALSLLGQSNQFPSTGRVNADYIVVPGGDPAGGIANKGYSFGTGGDPDGGMFSNGDNNVSLWANGTKKFEISNVVNNLYGSTINYGPFTSNDLTVNGNQGVTGTITSGKLFTKTAVNGGGYAFQGDDDSGLFGTIDGETEIRSNGNSRILVGANGTTYINGNFLVQNGMSVQGSFFVNFLPFGDRKEMQYDNITGQFFYDNSSRRFKRNITPLADDFKLILKAQPKTYTRPDYPGIWEVGYIAEEMDSIGLKTLVTYDKEGIPDGYNYEKMILYVTEVLKIQNADIDALKLEVAALKSENAQLQSTNTTLNTSLEKQQAAFSAQLNELSKRMKLIEASNGMGNIAPGKK